MHVQASQCDVCIYMYVLYIIYVYILVGYICVHMCVYTCIYSKILNKFIKVYVLIVTWDKILQTHHNSGMHYCYYGSPALL